MCNRIKVVIFFAALTYCNALIAANADDGKTIFQSHCASCHMIDQRLVGPALKNVYKSQSENWIISFVHSPVKKIHSGDTAAANIYQKFQPIIMPDQADLNDDQVKSVIAYIKAESEKIAMPSLAANSPAVNNPTLGLTPVTWYDYWFWCGVATLLAILVYGLIILTRAYSAKQAYLFFKNKKG